MFINNILSNILYVYQSWKNLGTIGVSSRTGVIVIKKILQTTDPSHLSLDAIMFLFLNISYIIPHNAHFRNLKTNQVLYEKRTILNTFYYTWHNSCLKDLTNSSLSFLWILCHRVEWDFTFSALLVWSRTQIHPCRWSWLY